MIIELNVKLGIFDAGVKLRFRSNDESIILGAIHYKELRKYELLRKKSFVPIQYHSKLFRAKFTRRISFQPFLVSLVHFTEHLIGVIAPFQIAPD